MNRSGWGVLAVLAACSGTATRGLNQGKDDPQVVAEDALIQAVGNKDVAAVQRLLRAPLDYRGLLFPTPECAEQFPAPAQLGADKLPAFAKCLTDLPLFRSNRRHVLYGVSVFQYEPGIELEVQFRMTGRSGVHRIGYASGRGTPTITSGSLEAGRAEGDPVASLSPDVAAPIDAAIKAAGAEFAHAWIELCVDATGAVSEVHPREASTPRVHEAFAAIVKTWKFKPFVLGEQPRAVCSLLRLIHPADATVTAEVVPVPYPLDDVVRVPNNVLKRTEGTDLVPPDDDDKLELQNAGGGAMVGAFTFCIDPAGRVTKVKPLERTGFANYDRKLETALSGWAYQPFVSDGKPIEVCSAVVFVYQQS
ncbi:MAG: putative TonB protein [Deltaproteobacteria bacterium]|nr:putative TonB protein [Deltaproteobacteria bacterium]